MRSALRVTALALIWVARHCGLGAATGLLVYVLFGGSNLAALVAGFAVAFVARRTRTTTKGSHFETTS